MEEINGVTFRDYACASANLAGGMPVEKICEVLGIEAPVWEATSEACMNKMAELSPEDMAFFSTVFTNPKQGKFANVEDAAGGVEDVLEKYPEWSDQIKMDQYIKATTKLGIEPDLDKEFGVSITQFSQLAMHWHKYYSDNVADKINGQEAVERVWQEREDLEEKWEAFYKEKYKNQSTNLGGDIDF